MLIPFIIYIRAIGIYLLITLPVLIAPFMYFLSAIYAFFYGWFAWLVFSLLYQLIRRIKSYESKMGCMVLAVIPSVAFAFQVLDYLNPELDAWNSGGYLLFPVVAVIAGWVSVFIAGKVIKQQMVKQEGEDMEVLVN